MKMNTNDVSTKLKAIIHECLMDDQVEISESMHLVDELGLDSMGLVDMAVQVEGEYDIILSEAEIETMNTFDDVKKMILEKTQLKQQLQN